MIRIDEHSLLMIEPKGSPTAPVLDRITKQIARALHSGARLSGGYRGVHDCTGAGCRSVSDNMDHFVRITDGSRGARELLTNSLAVHYVACHRSEVPPDQLLAIEQLVVSPEQVAACPDEVVEQMALSVGSGPRISDLFSQASRGLGLANDAEAKSIMQRHGLVPRPGVQLLTADCPPHLQDAVVAELKGAGYVAARLGIGVLVDLYESAR